MNFLYICNKKMIKFLSNFNWPLIGALIIPNVGGFLSTLSMMGQVRSPDGTAWYEQLIKPVWTPPNWLFGPAWIVLYTAMGYASYLIYAVCKGFTGKSGVAFYLYVIQLLLNWLWTPVFFGLHKVGLALIHMIVLDVLAIACAACFNSIHKPASYWMMPYLAWLILATCLNYTIWTLNTDDSDKANLID